MDVFVEGSVFSRQIHSGVSRYFLEILKGLAKKEDCSLFLYLFPETKLTNLEKIKAIKLAHFPDFFLKRILATEKCGVFQSSYYHSYDNIYIPQIITAYDCIHELFSHYFDETVVKTTTNNRTKCFFRSASVVAISQTTARDLRRIYNLPAEKIKIVYPGVDLSVFHQLNLNEKHALANKIPLLGEHFFLYIGGRAKYKNFARLLEAYKAASIYENTLLVFAGGGDWRDQEKELLLKTGTSDRVTLFPYVSDNFLVGLYNFADFHIITSLYEGFGMTMLEAFACGCPVVSSDRGALVESGGKTSLYFNPEDIREIKNKMEKGSSLRKQNRLISSGRIHAQKFSWEQAVNNYWDIYKKYARN